MKKFFTLFLVMIFFSVNLVFSITSNVSLLPNGDAENILINDIQQLKGYKTIIHPKGHGFLPYWTLSDKTMVTDKVYYKGQNSIEMTGGDKDVSAIIHSNFWQVKDPNMPFGLPLFPGKEIYISFYYKTSKIIGNQALEVKVKLGAVKGLPSQKKEFVLPPSEEWKHFQTSLTLSQMKWGAEIEFILPESFKKGKKVWIDNVSMHQNINGVNLAKNPSFERSVPSGDWTEGWDIPVEDQWVSWVGSDYREPIPDQGDAISGLQSLRCSVTYAEGSGISQEIQLRQKKVEPIILSIRSKLDNSIGNSPPGYWGPENLANLTVFVYFKDGTMQEVSPTFSLGVSDHDWDYRRFGFLPLKPIEKINTRFTILGSEPTTSLWIDNFNVFENGATRKDLNNRGIELPPRILYSSWRGKENMDFQSTQVSHDTEFLYISLPLKSSTDEIIVYLNPQIKSEFVNHRRYLYYAVKILSQENIQFGTVVEKQGYTRVGLFDKAKKFGIQAKKKNHSYLLSIPFKALHMIGPSFEPFGFNVVWKRKDKEHLWTGNAINNREMGRILFAKKPTVRVKSLLFGKRYFHEKDQSQDFVSHPQVYTGKNEGEIVLLNEGTQTVELGLTAGIRGKSPSKLELTLEPEKCRNVAFSYDAGLEKSTFFDLELNVNGKKSFCRSYPLLIPSSIDIVLDQEFYFPEEKEAVIEIHNRFRPILPDGKVHIEVRDLLENETVTEMKKAITKNVTNIHFDINNLRINPLPKQDYEVVVTYLDQKGKNLGSDRSVFGRINHTERRPLPPIKNLRVNEKGRLIINDNFRFFPIVPSVNIMEKDDAIKLGANIYRSRYSKNSTPFKDRNWAWKKNVYTLTIGPGIPHKGDPNILDRFSEEAEKLLVHPGFLSCYPKQFYYWKLPKKFIQYRKKVEKIIGNISSPRLVIWGHHDSSLLYDREFPDWPTNNPPVGYCYTKIMGRPGSMWRNSPFLTKTERILNPHRFLLAEVNYYVSFHSDEVVPEQFPGYLSLRGDDWRGVKAESYLAVLYGADGLYHWICTQKHQIQRLRGWFQELNFMWPIFVADDAKEKVEVIPADSRIEARMKKWKGQYYLLTVNSGKKAIISEIKIPGFENMEVKKLFNVPGKITVKGNTIKDHWGKYGVYVYKIEK